MNRLLTIMAEDGCTDRLGIHETPTVCKWTADPGWNPWTVTLAVLFAAGLLLGLYLLWRDPPPGDGRTWGEWWDDSR